MTRPGDFSLQALYEALDAQRQARGLSWAQATREISGRTARTSARSLSPSTVTGMRTRSAVEGDGVLQMLRWLKRSPESFMPAQTVRELVGAPLPDIAPGQLPRFDTKRLHAALNARRVARGVTWARVAKEIGVGVSSLSHLGKGGRTAFPGVMKIVKWLERPAADFTRASDR